MVGVCPPKDILGVDVQQSSGARGEGARNSPGGVELLVVRLLKTACLLGRGRVGSAGAWSVVCPPEKLMQLGSSGSLPRRVLDRHVPMYLSVWLLLFGTR